ncbi:MAG TPA: DUF697 domain-containing protein [Gaiellaceae bacterium]|nr:DUF697 domain-containing protein [Gaiellaceae bacterium]
MARPKLPLAPLAVYKLVRELRETTSGAKPLVVAGARSLADALRRELVRGGDATAVREAGLGALEDAAALVYVLAGEPTDEDERALRAADTAGVPIVALGPDPRTPIPYVYATDILPLRPGEGFPLEELGRLLGVKLDAEAVPLAARLPVLRRGIADAMIAKVARQNAIIGAAVFIPGVDFPVLTINQLRLVLRLAAAYGQEIDAERVPEILGVVAGGLGLRALARQALGVVPVAGWAVKGGIAYAGTRALGETAMRYFEARSSRGGGGPELGTARSDRA